MPTLWTFYSVYSAVFPWLGQVTKPAQIQRSETDSILLRGGSTMAYCNGAWTQGSIVNWGHYNISILPDYALSWSYFLVPISLLLYCEFLKVGFYSSFISLCNHHRPQTLSLVLSFSWMMR